MQGFPKEVGKAIISKGAKEWGVSIFKILKLALDILELQKKRKKYIMYVLYVLFVYNLHIYIKLLNYLNFN